MRLEYPLVPRVTVAIIIERAAKRRCRNDFTAGCLPCRFFIVLDSTDAFSRSVCYSWVTMIRSAYTTRGLARGLVVFLAGSVLSLPAFADVRVQKAEFLITLPDGWFEVPREELDKISE